MPIGNHLVRCNSCGKDFTVGDCIVFTCPECECKAQGHRWIEGVGICGRCGVRMFREGVQNPVPDGRRPG